MGTRILALDYGTKRIGVALSDELGWTAQPLETLERRTLGRDIAHLQHLVQTHEVRQVVVGLPLRLDGEEGPAVQAVHEFVTHLGEALSVPIVTWDERMTTRSAEDLLIAADVSRKKRKGVVDRVAAAILLQSYLEAQSPAETQPTHTTSDETVEEWEESLQDSPAYEVSSHPHPVPRGRRTRRVGRVSDDSMG
jgi:putative holliday junction resolvase